MNKYSCNILEILVIVAAFLYLFRYELVLEMGWGYLILPAVGIYGIYLNVKALRNHKDLQVYMKQEYYE